MKIKRICLLLLIALSYCRQFINTEITGTRDLDAQTYQTSFNRILAEQKQIDKADPKPDVLSKQNKTTTTSEQLQQIKKQQSQLKTLTKQPDSTPNNSSQSKFDTVNYAGDIASSLKSLLSPSSGLDQNLVKKLMEETGITDKQQLYKQYQAEKIEEKAGAEEEKQFEQKLSEWVKQEKEKSEQTLRKVENEEIILQSFSFYIKAKQSKKLYMKVPRGRPQNYLFHINIYWHADNNFVIPKNPSQSQILNLSINHNGKTVNHTKTYISHVFEWYQYQQNGNIQLKFDNMVGENIVVMVSLERLKVVADTIKQDNIDPMVKKLDNMVQYFKVKHFENVFKSKSEIGFKENEEALVAKLLAFTGVESIGVLVVMMVQLYYLQKLINNNNVMI